MTKFLTIWEVDTDRVPDNPEERYKNWTMMPGMVRKDLESGMATDWGMFAGRLAGYSISEGTGGKLILDC